MSKSYMVTGAYITLRVRNELDQEVVLGFHQGSPVPGSVNQDDLERHVRKGLVAEQGTREAELIAVPAGTPIPGEPPNVPVTEASGLNLSVEDRARRAQEAASRSSQRDANSRDGRPAVNASKAEWVDYAVTQRDSDTSEEDARAEAEAMTKADLVTRHGGAQG